MKGGPLTTKKMEDEELDRIDELVIDILTKSDKPLTTYKIAKEAGVSWSTVNIHCYRLKSMDMLREEVVNHEHGRKRIYWELVGKTPKLSEYID